MKLQANIISQTIPGILLASTITCLAFFVSSSFDLPVMMVSLLIGMIFNFFGEKKFFKKGIDFSASQILRFGVALLGFRLSIENVNNLGFLSISFIVILVFFTFFMGILISNRLFNRWGCINLWGFSCIGGFGCYSKKEN